jgi:hypothetical protein
MIPCGSVESGADFGSESSNAPGHLRQVLVLALGYLDC